MEDVSCTTENRRRKNSSREFRSDRDSTVKARTGSDAIQHWAHDTMTLGKTEERDTLNQAAVRIVKVTARAWSIQYEMREIISPASIKQAMEMQADAERRNREETLWSEGDQQSEISLARGKQQDCESVEQQSSVQDPGAQSQQEEKMSRARNRSTK